MQALKWLSSAIGGNHQLRDQGALKTDMSCNTKPIQCEHREIDTAMSQSFRRERNIAALAWPLLCSFSRHDVVEVGENGRGGNELACYGRRDAIGKSPSRNNWEVQIEECIGLGEKDL